MRIIAPVTCVLAVAFIAGTRVAKAQEEGSPEWSLRSTAIEACSCRMFCPCYFSTRPSNPDTPAQKGYCKFNIAHRVDSGKHGDVVLDGAKFWLAGDLGGDFASGKTNWCVLTFDPEVKGAQREALKEILGRLYAVQWSSFEIGPDAAISWEATRDAAHAVLGDNTAEISLARASTGMSEDPVVITNLRYWGAPRNDGFVLMPSRLEAYRAGENAFEFSDSNGFMITVDISSRDFK